MPEPIVMSDDVNNHLARFNIDGDDLGRYVASHVDGVFVRNEPITPSDPMRVAYSGPAGIFWNDNSGGAGQGRRELGF